MDYSEMAACAGLTTRELPRDQPLDAEELAMRDETDRALGVQRDPRQTIRAADPWRYTGDEE